MASRCTPKRKENELCWKCKFRLLKKNFVKSAKLSRLVLVLAAARRLKKDIQERHGVRAKILNMIKILNAKTSGPLRVIWDHELRLVARTQRVEIQAQRTRSKLPLDKLRRMYLV